MNKQLSILSLFVLIALGVCVWLIQKPTYSEFEPGLLFTDLHSVAAKIDSVIIENSSGTLFKGVKSNDSWLAEVGYSGQTYPVDKKKLSVLINNLIKAKLVEAKTSKKINFERLGLQGIEQEDSLARLVTITTDKQTWQVLVGNPVSIGEGNYVRLPKQAQSWRLDNSIALPLDQFSWLKHPILPFSNQDIFSVARIDNNKWEINSKVDTEGFYLANLPVDSKLQYDGVLDGFVSSLTSLDYEELVNANDSFIDSLKIDTELNVVTKQGVEFNVAISKGEDIYYAHFTTTGKEEYWQDKYYQVSNFSAQQLTKVVTDFLAPPKEVNSIENSDSTKESIVTE